VQDGAERVRLVELSEILRLQLHTLVERYDEQTAERRVVGGQFEASRAVHGRKYLCSSRRICDDRLGGSVAAAQEKRPISIRPTGHGEVDGDTALHCKSYTREQAEP